MYYNFPSWNGGIMSDKIKLVIGILLITLYSSGIIYVYMDNHNVKMRVDYDKSNFLVKEDRYWKTSGTEYNKLFSGTKKLYRDVSETTIIHYTDGEEFKIIRSTTYKKGPVIEDIYLFQGNIKDVELFPISHTVKIYNGTGYFYRYEVRNLVYGGQSQDLFGTEMSFGRNMKVEWQEDYRWAKVYSSGILKVQYNINSDYEEYHVRLFDPLPDVITSRISPTLEALIENNLSGYCNASYSESNYMVLLYKLYKNDDVVESNTNFSLLNNYTCFQENSNGFTAGDGNCSLEYSGSYGIETSYFYINYTKPIFSINSSLWQVKHGILSTYNITMNNTCWDTGLKELQLRIYSESTPLQSHPECYNGTSWISIGNDSASGSNDQGCASLSSTKMNDTNYNTYNYYVDGTGDNGWCDDAVSPFNARIYEEAMFWVITNTTLNITNESIEQNVINFSSVNTSYGDEFILSCRSFDGINYSNWTNSSITTVIIIGVNYTLNVGQIQFDPVFENETDLEPVNQTDTNSVYTIENNGTGGKFNLSLCVNKSYSTLSHEASTVYNFSTFINLTTSCNSSYNICTNINTTETCDVWIRLDLNQTNYNETWDYKFNVTGRSVT